MPDFTVKSSVNIPIATKEQHGLMSPEDKEKLDCIATRNPPVFAPPVIMSVSGDMPDADIVLFGGTCHEARLPLTKLGRAYVVCHNMGSRTVVICSQTEDELFGYRKGYGLSRNESVSIALEPNTNRWRVL